MKYQLRTHEEISDITRDHNPPVAQRVTMSPDEQSAELCCTDGGHGGSCYYLLPID